MDRSRLRTLLVMTAGLLAALAVTSAGAILTFGLLQHETATSLSKSVRSVLLVEQLEAALRRLPATRAGAAEETSLRRLLSETSEVEQSPAEHAAVERLAGAVEVLLRERASGGSAPTLKAMLDSALAQDDALLQINLAEALAAESLAQRRASFSVGLAVAAAAGEVLAMAYLLLWARRRLLAPLEGLRRGIARISQGESGVRVPEDAPEELREAALTLNAMARVIDEGAEGRASFLARVGEALKGPLQLIGASLDHLLLSPPGASPDAVLNRVRTLQVQVGNLERVVHEFLDGARVEEGALALEPEPVDLRDLVRDSVEVFRTALPTQAINLSLPPAPVPVVVDPVRLTQTLNAGLVWSINRTRSGSTLEVELALQPSSDPSQEEARVCVRVRQGAAVRIEELFATLQQLDDRLRVVPGALLSLRTARKMAAAVGGSLAALDGVVTLALPLAGDTRERPTPGAPVIATGH